MELYTIQMSAWRKARDLNIPFLDTTVKSGVHWLAPTWEMVRDIKAGAISEEQYTKLYINRMVESYHMQPELWLDLIQKEKVAIACYCRPGVFCHRHILANLLNGLCVKQNIPFVLAGELS